MYYRLVIAIDLHLTLEPLPLCISVGCGRILPERPAAGVRSIPWGVRGNSSGARGGGTGPGRRAAAGQERAGSQGDRVQCTAGAIFQCLSIQAQTCDMPLIHVCLKWWTNIQGRHKACSLQSEAIEAPHILSISKAQSLSCICRPNWRDSRFWLRLWMESWPNSGNR